MVGQPARRREEGNAGSGYLDDRAVAVPRSWTWTKKVAAPPRISFFCSRLSLRRQSWRASDTTGPGLAGCGWPPWPSGGRHSAAGPGVSVGTAGLCHRAHREACCDACDVLTKLEGRDLGHGASARRAKDARVRMPPLRTAISCWVVQVWRSRRYCFASLAMLCAASASRAASLDAQVRPGCNVSHCGTSPLYRPWPGS